MQHCWNAAVPATTRTTPRSADVWGFLGLCGWLIPTDLWGLHPSLGWAHVAIFLQPTDVLIFKDGSLVLESKFWVIFVVQHKSQRNSLVFLQVPSA